jgi:hypothetical protein
VVAHLQCQITEPFGPLYFAFVSERVEPIPQFEIMPGPENRYCHQIQPVLTHVFDRQSSEAFV